jgi:hypothetical protein
MMASFMRTVKAPPTPRSSAVTGSPALLLPTTILPIHFYQKNFQNSLRNFIDYSLNVFVAFSDFFWIIIFEIQRRDLEYHNTTFLNFISIWKNMCINSFGFDIYPRFFFTFIKKDRDSPARRLQRRKFGIIAERTCQFITSHK